MQYHYLWFLADIEIGEAVAVEIAFTDFVVFVEALTQGQGWNQEQKEGKKQFGFHGNGLSLCCRGTPCGRDYYWFALMGGAAIQPFPQLR
ncbi:MULTISPECIES: hypothetical protein [unclassified Microbulbifer]|uniref:hypothetical protein n=1 Tax=unclassified Microbulbifer TaxID=2619833 RepID=UPI0027E3F182|nr:MULTISPECIES: hypothetical protein [unclassified Microbulbifer]